LATFGNLALVCTLEIYHTKTSAILGWRGYLLTTDDEHHFTFFGFVEWLFYKEEYFN
jgi:hypothetical protein